MTAQPLPLVAAEPRTRLLTIEEAAEMLRCTTATLRWMRRRSEGPPAVKLGRRLMYRAVDIEAWLERLYTEEARR